jgi:hypothetical protein
VKCDGCDADLTFTGNCEDWYLVLGNESKRPWYQEHGYAGGAVTSMAMYPPVNRTHHFCNLRCLDKWRSQPCAR